MPTPLRRLLPVALLASTALLAGCGSDNSSDDGILSLTPEPAGSAPHSHKVDGDGTTASAGGFTLEDLTFPKATDHIGRVSFRIVNAQGNPLTTYIEDQTKQLHLYVVRDDFQDFRHLHPTQASNGTWSGKVDVSQPGHYRVIAEFIPSTHTDLTPVVLGAGASVPGVWKPVPVPNGASDSDGIVEVAAPADVTTGFDQQLTFTVSDGAKGVVNLGTYLGAYAHLTAFDVTTGAFIHAHPLGEPTPGPDGSTLDFHVTLNDAGRYRFFIQVRVDGFLHTLALTVPVTKAAA